MRHSTLIPLHGQGRRKYTAPDIDSWSASPVGTAGTPRPHNDTYLSAHITDYTDTKDQKRKVRLIACSDFPDMAHDAVMMCGLQVTDARSRPPLVMMKVEYSDVFRASRWVACIKPKLGPHYAVSLVRPVSAPRRTAGPTGTLVTHGHLRDAIAEKTMNFGAAIHEVAGNNTPDLDLIRLAFEFAALADKCTPSSFRVSTDVVPALDDYPLEPLSGDRSAIHLRGSPSTVVFTPTGQGDKVMSVGIRGRGGLVLNRPPPDTGIPDLPYVDSGAGKAPTGRFRLQAESIDATDISAAYNGPEAPKRARIEADRE